MIIAATRRHKGEALARKQAFAQWRQDNHRCSQLQRRHACTHAFASPVLKKSPPAFAHSESKGTSTYRAYLRRCCMLPILLAAHRHKGKAHHANGRTAADWLRKRSACQAHTLTFMCSVLEATYPRGGSLEGKARAKVHRAPTERNFVRGTFSRQHGCEG
jgi:hypothetical protein